MSLTRRLLWLVVLVAFSVALGATIRIVYLAATAAPTCQ